MHDCNDYVSYLTARISMLKYFSLAIIFRLPLSNTAIKWTSRTMYTDVRIDLYIYIEWIANKILQSDTRSTSEVNRDKSYK